MPNRVFDAQIEDSVNYLLAGPQTVGQDTKGFWNYGGGYLTGSTVPPFIQSGSGVSYTQPGLGNTLYLYTPAYVNVRTTSVTDSIIVTGQFRPFMNVTNTVASTWKIRINVNRYKLINTSIPYFVDYINYETIAQDNNSFDSTTIDPNIQNGTFSFGETIFASVVDKPSIGYYAFVLDLEYEPLSGDPVLVSMYGQNIGITAAVIKI